MTTHDDSVLVQQEDPLGWVTINRPQAHNALNASVWRRLGAVIEDLGANPAVRVIIVRGAGESAFVSGADIGEFNRLRANAEMARAYDAMSQSTWSALQIVPKPVIAMIGGICFGGGVSIAASCDLRFASDDATFAVPALRLGLAYPPAAVYRLLTVVGISSATELLMTGRVWSATEAMTKGLIQRLFSRAELESKTREAAMQIAEGAPMTLAMHKRALRELSAGDLAPVLTGLSAGMEQCFDSADYREGVAAFLEKRKPQFRGR